jgi:acetyl-CoA acyltransferase 1
MMVLESVLLTPQAKKGGFKDCVPEDLLAAVFKETLVRSKVDPSKIG